MPPTHVFFDIGGVLGTNGWDTEQRASAAAEFGLDGEFDARGELSLLAPFRGILVRDIDNRPERIVQIDVTRP